MNRILSVAAVTLVAGAIAWTSSAPAQEQPAEGSMAPDFTLMDQNGENHSLSDYRGSWVVLYFYPKDDTPGCTTEACNFRDDIFRFREMGVTILGVSLDDVESHQAFAEKYSLPFTLLSDADAGVATSYGVLRSMGPLNFARRETFIIDPEGNVAKHYGRVDPDEHSAEVLGELGRLMAE